MAPFSRKYHGRDASNGTSSSQKKDFSSVMSETVHDMPRRSQLFSRFIHQKHIAALSQLLGTTIARPNALLCGAVLSFALTLIAYLISKNLGYRLSGFESIGAFVIGWAAGIVFDLVSPLFRKKK